MSLSLPSVHYLQHSPLLSMLLSSTDPSVPNGGSAATPEAHGVVPQGQQADPQQHSAWAQVFEDSLLFGSGPSAVASAALDVASTTGGGALSSGLPAGVAILLHSNVRTDGAEPHGRPAGAADNTSVISEFERKLRLYRRGLVMMDEDGADGATEPEDGGDEAALQQERVSSAVSECKDLVRAELDRYESACASLQAEERSFMGCAESLSRAGAQLVACSADWAPLVEADGSLDPGGIIAAQLTDAQQVVVMAAERARASWEARQKRLRSSVRSSTRVLKRLSQAFGTVQAVAQHVCPVCMSREVTHFLQPCGHTFCEACSTRALTPPPARSGAAPIRALCHMCRVQPMRMSRLYYT